MVIKVCIRRFGMLSEVGFFVFRSLVLFCIRGIMLLPAGI